MEICRIPATIMLMLLHLFALQGCTNNKLNNGAITGSTSGVSSVAAPPNNNSGSLQLSMVLPDTQNPGTVLDLLGDGSGSVGAYCIPTNNSTSGASSCSCSYSYTNTNGNGVSFEMPTIYIEANMIRCQYSGIPSTVSSVTVKIHLTNSNTYTNAITYNPNGGGNSLDATSSTSFVLASRYQCRDIVWIPYLLDPGTASSSKVYDPFQSEDPHLTYPFNFYTSNIGGAYAQYAGSAVSYWNCPSIPNDSAAGMNLTVYSVAPDSSGSKLVYPPSGSVFDRSTFYLAKSPTGAFTVPVNSYIAPNIVSVTATGSVSGISQGPPPPMGYGAAPVATGTNSETCPSTAIPQGFHWVKVWLFRASAPARNYLYSSALQQLASVSCNPGNWTVAPYANQSIYSDCAGSQPLTSTGALASRILGTKSCVNVSPGGTSNASQNLLPAYSTYKFDLGTDAWSSTGASSYSCTHASNFDPMHICGNSPGGVAYDTAFSLAPIDLSSRYDFLFVVSPVNEMATDMKSSSNTSNIYTPYRFMSAADCQSADPDNPSNLGDCSVGHKLTYGIKWHDVGLNGDPPASDPNRPGTFPICAIQPN